MPNSPHHQHSKGQAAILIIYVIGMVGLLIGTLLVKTGFSASLMGRGSVNTTLAFYVANSGIEDAFFKIRTGNFGNPGPDTYLLTVGEGEAQITVTGGRDDRVIESIGTYSNSARRIRVEAKNSTIRPGFTRAIQAGVGGIEFQHGVSVSGRYKNGDPYPVSVYSNSYVRGANNGDPAASDCGTPASTTQIAGNVFAVGNIEPLEPGDTGPCIEGDAFANNLLACRVRGTAYAAATPNPLDCPYQHLCDPLVNPESCKTPAIEPLPDIGTEAIKDFMDANAASYEGNCTIGGAHDCSTLRADGKKEIGNLIITGDLSINLSSNREVLISGPVWVAGKLNVEQNHTIRIAPEIPDLSQIILVGQNITVKSNTIFVSVNNSFLLLASEFGNTKPNVCADTLPAITIGSNVNSILFYAINGCISVDSPTAGKEFFGAIVGEGIVIRNNSRLIYDPALQDAEFFLRQRGGWQVLSFTEY